MKTFDDLFNEFFKRHNIKPEDKIGDNLKDEAKKMIDMLTNLKNFENNLDEDIQNIDEDIEKSIDEELGKPDKIEFFNEGDLFFERRIWHTPNGDLIKLLISDDPTLINTPKFEKPLQEQLDEAVAEENYEKAAAIRDKMNLKKTK
jgi:protein-arginine kinase activator protein McsA